MRYYEDYVNAFVISYLTVNSSYIDENNLEQMTEKGYKLADKSWEYLKKIKQEDKQDLYD